MMSKPFRAAAAYLAATAFVSASAAAEVVSVEEVPQEAVGGENEEQQQQQRRELQLDDYVYLDRNKLKNATLDLGVNNSVSDEAQIEFIRAQLPGMFNESDADNNRIIARFYPVYNEGDSSKDYYGWTSEGSATLADECDKRYDMNKTVASASFPTDYDLTEAPDNLHYYENNRTKYMTATVEDNKDLDGSTPGPTVTRPGSTENHVPILVSINLLKGMLREGNPFWHGDPQGINGDIKMCVSLHIEDRFNTETNETKALSDPKYEWFSYLYRDFKVFMGYDLRNNVFSIGNEKDQIAVVVDAVNRTQKYKFDSPDISIYQCRGKTTYTETDDEGADIAQNGQINLCISPDEATVDLASCSLKIYQNAPPYTADGGQIPGGDEQKLQEVLDKDSSVNPYFDETTPSGEARQPSLVKVYNRRRETRVIIDKETNETETRSDLDVQKIDIQTLSSQAGMNLTGVGKCIYRFRNSRRQLSGGEEQEEEELREVSFKFGGDINAQDQQQQDKSSAANLRALQGNGLQGNVGDAGSRDFGFVIPVGDLGEHDGDLVEDGGPDDLAQSDGEPSFQDTYSAAAAAASTSILKVFGSVMALMATVVMVL